MRLALIACCALFFAAACQPTDPPPPEPAARVYFVTPSAGDTVATTFDIQMAVEGMTLAAAGTMEPGTGHLHVMIDQPFIEAGLLIPKDEQHLHFGDAAVQSTLTLDPGAHTLRLQFADGAHIALPGPQYRAESTIYVR